MPSRREFLFGTVGLLAASAVGQRGWGRLIQGAGVAEAFKGREVFDRIWAKALAGGWAKLPIGECMGKVARELEGTPYVGFTLEISEDHEQCVVNLEALDCVTFFEDTLNFARMLKKGGKTPEDLIREVSFTRYRGGVVGDFTSRLHYTNDWFHDNVKKGVVVNLCDTLPGNAPFTQNVGIMSAKPKGYKQLAAHPELIPTIAKLEAEINSWEKRFIPAAALPEAEKQLHTGDIVGIATSTTGIDISHTGLVIVDDAGVPHFMDASSAKSKMKVTFEPGPLSKDISGGSKMTGAIFARPLEPVV